MKFSPSNVYRKVIAIERGGGGDTRRHARKGENVFVG